MSRMLFVLLFSGCVWLAHGQADAAAVGKRFVIYNVQGQVEGLGGEFSEEQFVDHGLVKGRWKGVLLFDANEDQWAIVWRTVERGNKIQERMDSGAVFLRFNVEFRGGKDRMVMTAIGNGESDLPSGTAMHVFWLEGGKATNVNIDGATIEHISRRFRGNFWLMNEGGTDARHRGSYRTGKMVARYDSKATVRANLNARLETLADLIQEWETLFRGEGWFNVGAVGNQENQ